MILVAEMQSGGVFEAASKKKLTNQMIQHFAENSEDAGQIKAIYYVLKNDKTNEICSDAVSRIQEIIDDGVAKWRKTADEEYCGRKQIESEIRGAIYG